MKKKKLKKRIKRLQRSLTELLLAVDDAADLFAHAAPVQWVKDQNQDKARAWSLLAIGWLGRVVRVSEGIGEVKSKLNGENLKGKQVRTGQGVVGEVISDDGAKVVVRWTNGVEGTFFSREALKIAGIELA